MSVGLACAPAPDPAECDARLDPRTVRARSASAGVLDHPDRRRVDRRDPRPRTPMRLIDAVPRCSEGYSRKEQPSEPRGIWTTARRLRVYEDPEPRITVARQDQRLIALNVGIVVRVVDGVDAVAASPKVAIRDKEGTVRRSRLASRERATRCRAVG